MDAANPLSRWLLAVGLLLPVAAGCHVGNHLPLARLQAPDEPPNPLVRPQAPNYEPLPPAPAAAPYTGPVSPAVPVQGQSLTRTVPAAYSPIAVGLPKSAAPQAVPAVKQVAIVGSSIITDQEVWESVRQRMGEYLYAVDGPNGKETVRDDAREKAIYFEELRRIIERELILDEMYTRLKKAKPGAIDDIKDAAKSMADRQLREFKKMFKVKTDEELQAILSGQGLTLPVIRRQLERQMMADEYVRSMIKDKIKAIGLAQVRDYYDRHPDEFRTDDRVKWLDVFVSLGRFPTPRAAYDYALAVQQKASAGADFLALVMEHDQGVARHQNGEGLGQKRGEIRPVDVESTVWSLQPGQVSGLIETPAGYHVVKVVEREHAGVRPFDEAVQDLVRKKLIEQLMKQERVKLVEDLWYRGVVKILIEVPG
jgi:parvulin-like peptidyl-prolyl isomerase